jgi:hypothetical protein
VHIWPTEFGWSASSQDFWWPKNQCPPAGTPQPLSEREQKNKEAHTSDAWKLDAGYYGLGPIIWYALKAAPTPGAQKDWPWRGGLWQYDNNKPRESGNDFAARASGSNMPTHTALPAPRP